MADDCNAFLPEEFVFPRRPLNRPALERIDYRIATYPDFVETLTRGINRAPELRGWTHRGSDDPGIALLEGAAILGDILTFYQERYANEAFLRTAAWRESVAELTRLTGYRLAPGVGGQAVFAFEVKGATPVTIPAGFPLKADLEAMDKPADFQTAAELAAHAHLSRFNLYRPRTYDDSLAAGTATVELRAVDGVTGPLAADAVKLKAGDRLLLLPDEPAWTATGQTIATAQKTPQIVKVKAVRRILDRTLVDLDGQLAEAWVASAAKPLQAFRLGRSFRHFGHNGPSTRSTPITDGSGAVTGSRIYDTAFARHVGPGHDCTLSDCSIALPGNLIPLDQQADDLNVGDPILVRTRVREDEYGAPFDLVELKTIAGLRTASIGFAVMTGSSTLLTLDSALIRSGASDAQADVRDYQIHEVTSPALALSHAAYDAADGAAFADGNGALCFFGTSAEAQSLAGRRLLLADAGGRLADLVCTNLAADFVLGAGEHEPRLWTLSFDAPPSPFTRADFDESSPTVTVFGNLAAATQGKAEAETVLGNGDARLRFQTFKLPKPPLTYLLSAGATPPQTPEIEIRINGRLWTRVESFFGRGALEEIYLVREDADGISYVQFGDGETGARLPSGVKNVSAAWRTGSGAHGLLKAGAKPSAGGRITGLDKVQLPGTVSGGAAPETEGNARRAAPGKVQGLGRLVSLADYESETLTIPGVTAAAAAWSLRDGVPGLRLRVLLAGGREAEFEAVRATLQSWQRCRGPDRFPVTVEQAFLRYLWLDLQYAGDPTIARVDLEAAMRAALGLVGDSEHTASGLFGLARRRLGEKEYASRIEGRLQQVAGVLWCRVTALGLFPSNDPSLPGDDDPAALVLPAAPRPCGSALTPADDEMLQLAARHLTLTATAAPAGACR